VELQGREKVHQSVFHQPEVTVSSFLLLLLLLLLQAAATFTVEYGLQEDLMVVLEIEDETRVETFEVHPPPPPPPHSPPHLIFKVVDPAGSRHIFSQVSGKTQVLRSFGKPLVRLNGKLWW